MPIDEARRKIYAMWKRRPEIVGREIKANWGTAHPISLERTRALLKECRMAAGVKSPMHRRVGWFLDCRTATRIKIGRILNRHPRYIGRRVLEKLGPTGHPVRLVWVLQVMRECRLGAPKHRGYRPWKER